MKASKVVSVQALLHQLGDSVGAIRLLSETLAAHGVHDEFDAQRVIGGIAATAALIELHVDNALRVMRREADVRVVWTSAVRAGAPIEGSDDLLLKADAKRSRKVRQ